MIVSDVVSIAAATLAIALVYGISRRQRERFERHLAGSASLTRIPALGVNAPRADPAARPAAQVEHLRTPGGSPCPHCGFENHPLAPSCLRCHRRLDG